MCLTCHKWPVATPEDPHIFTGKMCAHCLGGELGRVTRQLSTLEGGYKTLDGYFKNATEQNTDLRRQVESLIQGRHEVEQIIELRTQQIDNLITVATVLSASAIANQRVAEALEKRVKAMQFQAEQLVGGLEKAKRQVGASASAPEISGPLTGSRGF